MSFLDLYQGDQEQAAKIQPNEGTRLPSGFTENFNAAWSDGKLFSQSIARTNARNAVLGDYVNEIRQKTGNDLSKEFFPDAAGGGQTGVTDFSTANDRVAALKKDYPDLDLDPLTDDEIDKRAVAKAQAAHQTYEKLQAGEKSPGGSIGSFLGSTAASAADPINIVGLAIAPEAQGISILSSALRWGALAGVSQAAIEFSSDQFKEQVQPGYMESGGPMKEMAGAFVGGAVVGGTTKAIIPVLGAAWTRAKTGQWPTSVRDAGNVIEGEAHTSSTNPFPGIEGEVAHKEALAKATDDILANRPVDVSAQITPELQQAAAEAERAKAAPQQPTGMPTEQLELPLQAAMQDQKLVVARQMPDGEVKIGEPGQIHSDLMTKAELATDSDAPEVAASMGYANADGKFLTRQEALDFAQRNEPQRAAWSAQQPEFGLDAATYNEAVQPTLRGRERARRRDDTAPQPPLQTAKEMNDTLTAPDHQDAIRADIDRARAMGDVQVPGVDENGNHTMIGVDKAMDQVDAYKAVAEQIQACANPIAEAAE